MKWENYATAVLQSTAEFVETKLDCVCCLTVRVRQQYAPYYQGFGRQAHNYPVIFCPHLPFRGKSKNKINNNNKKLVQHEIVKGPGYVGGFWGGVFCLSLMTVAFLKHPFIIMYVCHVWTWRRQGSLAGLETLNTSHQAECWYISAGAGKFLYTTSSLPPSPGINRKERAYIPWEQSRDWSTFHYVERTGRWDWEHYFFASGCSCQLFMKGEFSLRRAESPWNRRTGFNFSVGTHWERPNSFSVFTNEKHQNVKTTDFLSFALPS